MITFFHYHITKKKLKKHWRWPQHNAYIMCHTHDIMKQHNETSLKEHRQNTDMEINEYSQTLVLVTDQERHIHQWQLIGARLKIAWKKAVRHSDILHRKPRPHRISNQMLPPREWTQTSTWEAYDALRNEQVYTLHTGGVSPFPASLFHLFHFHDVSTVALYNK